jgi:predicted Holliday junction resolvase-like endonuclease
MWGPRSSRGASINNNAGNNKFVSADEEYEPHFEAPNQFTRRPVQFSSWQERAAFFSQMYGKQLLQVATILFILLVIFGYIIVFVIYPIVSSRMKNRRSSRQVLQHLQRKKHDDDVALKEDLKSLNELDAQLQELKAKSKTINFKKKGSEDGDEGMYQLPSAPTGHDPRANIGHSNSPQPKEQITFRNRNSMVESALHRRAAGGNIVEERGAARRDRTAEEKATSVERPIYTHNEELMQTRALRAQQDLEYEQILEAERAEERMHAEQEAVATALRHSKQAYLTELGERLLPEPAVWSKKHIPFLFVIVLFIGR